MADFLPCRRYIGNSVDIPLPSFLQAEMVGHVHGDGHQQDHAPQGGGHQQPEQGTEEDQPSDESGIAPIEVVRRFDGNSCSQAGDIYPNAKDKTAENEPEGTGRKAGKDDPRWGDGQQHRPGKKDQRGEIFGNQPRRPERQDDEGESRRPGCLRSKKCCMKKGQPDCEG